ncbi:hypothetical protein F2Q69_00013752 [Brassica cretica]|uniref:Uncharacterized protein n=1 Tax=Brassica cretica TaxID=69181 RepID=A0A8S9R2M7_BRACR|nr:hypothetical protein F2Q69_00013752 [Brassica cretica]
MGISGDKNAWHWTDPTRLVANWKRLIQLAIGRVGNGSSNSPNDELDLVGPTRCWASWKWFIQLAQRRVGCVSPTRRWVNLSRFIQLLRWRSDISPSRRMASSVAVCQSKSLYAGFQSKSSYGVLCSRISVHVVVWRVVQPDIGPTRHMANFQNSFVCFTQVISPLNTAGKASLEAGSSLTTSWQGHWKWQLDPVMGRLLDCAG